MFSGNTETNITATYQDGDGTIDLVSTNTTYSVGDGGLTQNNFTNTLKSKLDGIAASATNVTNNNQLTNGAGYITATLTTEQVQDIVGGMFSGNTETNISATYQDSDGTIDLVSTNTTYSVGDGGLTQNNFTNTLKSKLDGIESSATADQTASEILTAIKTVDGSGSGLDADTLDGLGSGSFLRSDADDTASYRIQFANNATDNHDTIATDSGSQGGLEVYNSGSGNDAFMCFHVGADYALYFGLDATTNDLSVGGWSMGANKYRIWHAGNDGASSGLDADLLDGKHDTSFLRSDAGGGSASYNATSDITFSGGGGAVTLAANSDIRLVNGTWSGDYGAKIQHHDNYLYLQGGSNGVALRNAGGSRQIYMEDGGTFRPANTQSGYHLGSSSNPWDSVRADYFYGDGSNLSGIASFASGTKMVFNQTSAPTGWTKVTSNVDNRALRVVSGSAGSGGSVAFTTAFASQSVGGSIANTTAGGSISTNNATAGGSVANATLNTSQLASHRHWVSRAQRDDNNFSQWNQNSQEFGLYSDAGSYSANDQNHSVGRNTAYTGSGSAHSHNFSGSAHSHTGSFSGSAHNHSFSGTAINLAVQYIDVIIASKD